MYVQGVSMCKVMAITEIQGLDTRIEHLASKRYPETGLLRQVSGVGSLTALSYVLTLEDPQRFKSSRAIGPLPGSSSETEPARRYRS